jgi:hypothetical protein
MHLAPTDSCVSFSGNYSGRISSLSKDSQTLAKKGVEAINTAKNYLTKLQNIDCGGFTLSNYEKVTKIRPVLKTGVGEKEVILSAFNDGFNLVVNNRANSRVDLLNIWGGDRIEFESSKFPLKSRDYKPLDGETLKSVEQMLKKYIPIFCKK